MVSRVVPANQGEYIKVAGDEGRIILSGDDTGGAFSVVELEVLPGRGTPYHVHAREDEMFYVVQGEFRFWIGKDTKNVKQGDVVFGARTVEHCFQCIGEEPGRLLVTLSPAGFEEFFREATAAHAGGEMTPERLTQLAAEYGCTIFGPPPSP